MSFPPGMHTRRQRVWYSVYGIIVYSIMCVLLSLHIQPWCWIFVGLTAMWMVSIYAYLIRDLREKRGWGGRYRGL